MSVSTTSVTKLTREALTKALTPFGPEITKRLETFFTSLDQTFSIGEVETTLTEEQKEQALNYAGSIFAARMGLKKAESEEVPTPPNEAIKEAVSGIAQELEATKLLLDEQTHAAALFLKHIAPHQLEAMNLAITALLKEGPNTEATESLDQEKATQLLSIYNSVAKQKNFNHKLFIQESLKKFDRNQLAAIQKVIQEHLQKSPQDQKESINFMDQIAESIKGSAPGLIASTVLTLCSSLVAWIPVVGEPLNKMLQTIATPLMYALMNKTTPTSTVVQNRETPKAAPAEKSYVVPT